MPVIQPCGILKRESQAGDAACGGKGSPELWGA